MSVQVIDNFSYKGKKGNFERDNFDTLQAMRSYPEDGIDDGHVCFCNEDGNHYKFNHLNSVDGATGRWRLHNKSVNTLTETGEGKVLDARQGKILKDLIDAKVIEAGGVSFDTVPTKNSINPVTSNGIKEAMDEQAESINSNMGVNDYPVFSTTEDYKSGDVVNYQGKLYKFTADHAAGAWTGSDVVENSLKEDIQNTAGYYLSLIIDGIPVLDRTLLTFTIPSGSRLLGNNGDVTLDEDLVFSYSENPVSNSAILIYNIENKTKRYIDLGQKIILNSYELVLAVVRWQDYVVECNTRYVIVDGEQVEFKPTKNLEIPINENASEISNINDLLISESCKSEVEFTLKKNYYWDSEYVEHPNFDCTEQITILAGELYLIKGIGGTNGRLVFLYNNNGDLIIKAPNNQLQAFVYVQEDGYMICNTNNSVQLHIYKITGNNFSFTNLIYGIGNVGSLKYDYTRPAKISNSIQKFDFYCSDEYNNESTEFRFAGIGKYETGRTLVQIVGKVNGVDTLYYNIVFASSGDVTGIQDLWYFDTSMRWFAHIVANFDYLTEGVNYDYNTSVMPIFLPKEKVILACYLKERDNLPLSIYEFDDFTPSSYYYLNTSIGNTAPQNITEFPETGGDGYVSLLKEVNVGDIVIVSVYGGSNGRAYALTDINRVIYDIAEASLNTTNAPIELHVKKQGYLYINSNYSSINLKENVYIAIIKSKYDNYDVRRYDNEGNVIPTDNPCAYLITSQSLASCILKWGFIGDSYGAGEIEYTEDGETKFQDNQETLSFGKRFMQMNNVDGYVFAQGGQTAKGWCTGGGNRTWENAQKQENLQHAYIIQLGSNDANTDISVGNVSDIDTSNYNNNADTFAGWYAGIIQRILSVQPKAIIFAATVRYASDAERRLQMSAVIRQICNLFPNNVYCVDIEKYGIKWNSPFGNNLLNGGHPSALGHLYQAIYYNTYIDWIIRNNMSKFKKTQFIGTNME